MPTPRGTIATDGWNHNTHYHERLLRAVPAHCRRALDVGCGLGGFARRLARVSEHVDAIDLEAAVISRACELSSAVPNLRFVAADFRAWPIGDRYDFVSMIATLHHLPFADALTRAADALQPGGCLRCSAWIVHRRCWWREQEARLRIRSVAITD